jgi:hypothetical protein
VRTFLYGVFVPSAEGGDVVEDPEGPAVGSDDEIVTMNHEIADGADGQVILQRAPSGAIVEGNEDADFGAGEKQAFAHGIFAYGVDIGIFWQACDGLLPRLAVIVRAIDIRMKVVNLMAVDCCISCGRVVAGSFDQADLAPVFYAGGCDIGPVRAFILGELD